MLSLLPVLVAVVVGAVLGHFLWPDAADTDLVTRTTDLEVAVAQLIAAEAAREATTLDALDKFDRLFKRIAARQSREDGPQSTNASPVRSESVLEMRDRLRAR